MPNWCFSSYVLTGERKQLDELYGIMEELEGMSAPLIPNGFGTQWLGNLAYRLGIQDDDLSAFDCRGNWENLSRDPNGDIRYGTVTAWGRCSGTDDLILKKYPGIALYYIEEETGNEVYKTNDADGCYFPGRFIIDIEDEDVDYYTLDQALGFLSTFFRQPVSSWEDALRIAKYWNDAVDEEMNEHHVWLHEFEIEN